MELVTRALLPGLAAVALLFMVSCGGNAEELTAVRAAVDSLRQGVESLRVDLAGLSQGSNDADQPFRGTSAPARTTDGAGDSIAQATAELEKNVRELASVIEGQNTAEAARLGVLVAELAALMDALRTEIKTLENAVVAGPASPREYTDQSSMEAVFTMQLLHASDMDSSTGALSNVENFSAILDGFRQQYPDNTIVLSSGDNYIPGPRYFAAADEANSPVLGVPGNGRGDIAFLNAMGFQASALGNHELDQGTGAFADMIRFEAAESKAYPGAAFPYLASNLVFASDENLAGLAVSGGQEASLVGGSLAKSAVVTIGGERVGGVGATTPGLKRLTKGGGITVLPPPDEGVDKLAAVIQQEVDALVAQDVNKIILLAHMQRLNVEKELATKLKDVDIIVAGGSNTLLADATDRLRTGDEAADTYPLLFESAKGEPSLVVNTDGDYRYLGRLVVDFNLEGLVIPVSIDAHVSGAYATDRQGGQRYAGQPIPEVSRIAESLRNVLGGRHANIYGKTSVYLAGLRRDVRTQETNLGNLTADANLWLARHVDPEVVVSLKNGGGIRDAIGLMMQPPGTAGPSEVVFLPPPANPESGEKEGDISQYDIEGTLRFNDGLVILRLTAGQLVDVMEHSIGFDGAGTATEGRFSQVGGMRFSFDPAAPPGRRVRSLAIVDGQGAVIDRVVEAGELAGDPERQIRMVTSDFLAGGGDDYPFPASNAGRIDLSSEAGGANPQDPDSPDTNGNGGVDTPAAVDPGLADFAAPGTEQDALSEYLAHFHSENPFDQPETSPLEDRRIQNLGVPGKRDTVFGL